MKQPCIYNLYDKAIGYSLQQMMVQNNGNAKRTYAIPGSHTAFFSMPAGDYIRRLFHFILGTKGPFWEYPSKKAYTQLIDFQIINFMD